MSIRLAAQYAGCDNQVEYYSTGEPISEPRGAAVRGTLLWEPTDKIKATLTLGYEEINDRTEAMLLAPYDDEQIIDMPEGSLDANRDSQRTTLNVTHELSNMILTSVTGYTQMDSTEDRLLYDKFLANALLGMDVTEGDKTLREQSASTFYQELRVSSRPKNELFWVAGVNVYHADRDLTHSYDNEHAINYMAMNGIIDSNFKTTDYAIFGEITYPVTSRLNLTGGLRYTWDKKEYESDWTPADTNPYAAYYGPTSDSDERDSSFITGRACVSYAVTDNANTYFTYARGYKAQAYQDFATGYIYTGEHDDLVVDAQITGVPATSVDVREGNDVPCAPNWNAMASISYTLALPPFWGIRSPSFYTSVTNRYVGERKGDAANSFESIDADHTACGIKLSVPVRRLYYFPSWRFPPGAGPQNRIVGPYGKSVSGLSKGIQTRWMNSRLPLNRGMPIQVRRQRPVC